MKKQWSTGTEGWLTGSVLAVFILLGRPVQGQNTRAPSSFVAGPDNAMFYGLTYAGDRPDGLTPDGLIMIGGKAGKPCEPHLGVGGRHRPRNQQRQPRKANPGKRNSSIPCEQQPIVKLRRHRGPGGRV